MSDLKRWRGGAGLLLVLMLAGCGASSATSTTGGSGSSPGAAAAPRACSILTPDLVTPVIGADAKQTMDKQPNPKETLCQYTSSTGALNVTVGDWTVIKPISSTTPLSGVGDEAGASNLGTVAKKGTLGISVLASLAFGSFSGSEADTLQARERAAEKDLATKLLAKL